MTGYGIQHPLVGLVGVKRSGKDTFARGLAARGYTRVAFADPLREMVEGIDPFLGGHLRLSYILENYGGWEGVKDTHYADEARRLLQNAGQAVRRYEPDFWLRVGMAKAHEAAYHGSGGAVITDVRYRNEAEAISKAGGILVRVVRPGLVSTDTHASETELADYPTDFTVRNSGTAEEFEEFARTLRF